jgi:hypothetical protein
MHLQLLDEATSWPVDTTLEAEEDRVMLLLVVIELCTPEGAAVGLMVSSSSVVDTLVERVGVTTLLAEGEDGAVV